MDRIINNFLFQQKLTCMVRILKKKTYNSMDIFSKYVVILIFYWEFVGKFCLKVQELLFGHRKKVPTLSDYNIR